MRLRIGPLILLLLTVFYLSSCVAWVENRDFSRDPPLIKDKSVPEFFKTDKGYHCEMHWYKEPEKENSYYKVYSFVQYNSANWYASSSIGGELYIPKKLRSPDYFIVLPGMNLDYPAQRIADRLATFGFPVIRIYSGFDPLPKYIINGLADEKDPKYILKKVESLFLEYIQNHTANLMRLMDYLSNFDSAEQKVVENPIKPRSFHVAGYSLGGIEAALLAGVDSRIESLLMISASGSLARIFTDCPATIVKSIGSLHVLLFNKFGMNKESVYVELKKSLRNVEPNTYASRVDPSRVVMVTGCLDLLGIIDTAIPYSAAQETWEAFKKPEWINLLFYGHVTSLAIIAPVWIELPTMHIILFESYLDHILKSHYLPKALKENHR